MESGGWESSEPTVEQSGGSVCPPVSTASANVGSRSTYY